MFIKKRRNKIFLYGILFLLIATVLSVNKKNTRIFFLNYIESLISYNLGFSSINNLIDDGKLSVDNKSVDVLNIGDGHKIKALAKNLTKIISYQNNKESLSNLPRINIIINFKNYRKILNDRSDAIKNNYLSSPTYVRGTLEHNGKKYKANIRLKGDLSDHWYAETRMSLRVKLKKGDSILGFRKFNISKLKSRQHPYDESFQIMAKKIGNISSNHKLSHVTVNGRSYGLMLIEEVVSKELIEKQKRRDSMIFRFSDDRSWKFPMKFNDRNAVYFYKWYRLSDPKYFTRIYNEKKYLNSRTNRNVKTYVLEKNINQPIILLDKERYIKNFILAFIWNNFHIMNDINHKAYWNPFTLLLEPVTFDQAPFVLINQPVEIFLANVKKELSHHYAESLSSINNMDELNTYINDVIKHFDSIDKILNKNNKYFPLDLKKSSLVLKQNIDFLITNKERIFEWCKSLSGHKYYRFNESDYKKLLTKNVYKKNQLEQYVHTRHYENGKLLFFNLLPEEIVVNNILVDGKKTKYKNIIIPGHNEIDYKPFVLNSDLTGIYDNTISIESQYKNNEKIIDRVGVTLASDIKNPLNRKSLYKENYFEKINKKDFLIKKGNWDIKKPLILEGNLIIREDTQLNFSKNSYLIVIGSVKFEGSQDKPIIFQGKDRQWGGIYILSKDELKSTLKNVLVKNISGINDGILNLESGITIYKGDIRIDNLKIENSKTEDAMNIVSSKVDISKLFIDTAVSDALDCDFCTGIIKRSKFYNIFGDAVDFSGSNVSLNNITIQKVKDKGLSVGENSEVFISDSSMRNIGIGIASKDGSKTIAENTTIDDYKLYAGMTYIKKSFYYNYLTSLKINRVKNKKKNAYKSQEGTFLSVNGAVIEKSKIDVKKMYKSEIMKK